ncbi:MAG: glutamine synthetase beta-grasp domain-containing protein, partial [Pseudomonadota bacterium]
MSEDLLKRMSEEQIEFVDLRFTDPKGKMQHVTFDKSMVDEDFFADGQMFDGSSISGWKAINESDMTLMPDTDTAIIDPFYQQKTMAIFCDILDPLTGQPYGRDPRTTAKKAEAYLKSTGVGTTAYFGPEAEFFVFDDVRWNTDAHKTGYEFDSTELPANTGKVYEGIGNMGHRPWGQAGGP